MSTELTKAQFVERFTAHMIKVYGASHFDDGTPVTTYAADTVESYWSDPALREEGPEDCAEVDMQYWGD